MTFHNTYCDDCDCGFCCLIEMNIQASNLYIGIEPDGRCRLGKPKNCNLTDEQKRMLCAFIKYLHSKNHLKIYETETGKDAHCEYSIQRVFKDCYFVSFHSSPMTNLGASSARK